MAQIYQANIQLIGSVDPSMAAATGLTLNQLKKLQQAIGTVNAMTNKSALALQDFLLI